MMAGAIVAAAMPAETLVVFHAGSLNAPMQALAGVYERLHPGAVVRLTSGGSVDLAERATDPAHVPDVLAVADYAIIPQRLMPQHASWYASFARNAMVLAYSEHSRGASDISPANWVDVVLRSGVRAAHSDPALDPGGYRAVLLFQLAAAHYGRPELAERLAAGVPSLTPTAPSTLYDALRAGQLDYLVTYRSSAISHGFKIVSLPREVDLSDPALAERYATAVIRVASTAGSPDSVGVRGEPIVYGVTVLAHARHPASAKGFVRLLLSAEGADRIEAAGLLPIRPAIVVGPAPEGIGAA
jgi:molybdate/tungstate transport system substrate-binding protein